MNPPLNPFYFALSLFPGFLRDEKVAHIDLQRSADVAQGLDGHVVLAGFNPAEIGALHAAAVCDCLDGQALGFAAFAHTSANVVDEDVVVCHYFGIYRLSFGKCKGFLAIKKRFLYDSLLIIIKYP